MNLIENSLMNISYVFIRRELKSTSIENSHINKITNFVVLQFRLSPKYVKFGMGSLVILFLTFTLALKFRRFSGLTFKNQSVILESWKNSSFSPFSDFIKYVESFTILALYDLDKRN